MKLVKTIGCAVMALSFSAVGHAEMNTNNVVRLIDKGEISLAAEVLADEINSEMSLSDIDCVMGLVKRITANLRGRDPSLAIRTFVPPDRDFAYKQVVSEDLEVAGMKISASWVKTGSQLTPFMAWGNDAQRLMVMNSYYGKWKLVSAEEAQQELDRYDAVKSVVVALNKVVLSRCKTAGDDLDSYINVKRDLSSIKENLKIDRTRYLSYGVVSPYLYEAHCHLFAGISEGVKVSSLNKLYPTLGEEQRMEGVKLLAKSCHKDWLYSCDQCVRDQFLEVQKYMKENGYDL